ncbi:MAG: D-2-hydroxyacid dehydrogenase [Pirellulales bacterium]|nr:D-2-hydroxyacid dehydrogenase [Pirellulales bacterium]
MRIVVLDGYTLNPGDLSWDDLRALGACDIYPRTPPHEVVPRAKDAEIVLTNKAVVSREVIEQLPKLRYVGVLATGYNVVDTDAARERGILVVNVPTYGTSSVAQMVFAHLLNLAQHVGHHAQTVAQGRWAASEEWCYWDYPLVELAGLTMGLVGFGRIGQATARLALAFGMRVLACDAVAPSAVPDGVEIVDLDTLLRRSDVISLHCPLTPETRALVNAARLELVKPTAVLINTSRGPLLQEQALADALNSGRLAAAALDVLSTEPPAADNPLLTAKNCFITPHIAWATREARQRLLGAVVENVKAFLDGRPQNVVNR